jgi:hypothetical protein
MNIFVLDTSPVLAAQSQCDKHVVKMIVESAQMLSTAHRLLDGTVQHTSKQTATGKLRRTKVWKLADPNLESRLYAVVHPGHPCTLWTCESMANYIWHAMNTSLRSAMSTLSDMESNTPLIPS